MSKLKRPEKIQTGMNGNSGTSSTTTSPSISTKRPPSAPILPPGAVRNNPALSNGVARSAVRPNRDVPTPTLGRGQRTTSSGLRSASIANDTTVAQVTQPQPYIQSDEYILKKYRGSPASLIVHLHPTHFRFDQQDGTFTYKSPMKMFLEHLRAGTVPHDLMEYFTLWNVTFYEGCLIVEVHDHKSVAATQEPSQTITAPEKTDPFSIHNYNNYLTPSSWVPYPKENLATLTKIASGTEKSADDPSKVKGSADKDKENMPAPIRPSDVPKSKAPAKKAKITTIVLHPTALSSHLDLAIKTATPLPASSNARRESRQDGAPLSATSQRPQTPLIAVPSTPHLGMDPPTAKRAKKEKMELDSKNIHQAQSQITLATTAPLFLEPVETAAEFVKLMEALSHPEHSAAVPSPKVRKKTVAEMAAEESAAADEEKYMLILDERYNNGAPGGANTADGDGQVGGASFEPRFERFKAIEAIKLQVIENKKKEKIQQAEAAKRQQQEGEARERARVEALKRQEEEQRQRNQQMQHQQQMQQQRQQAAQEIQRRQLAVQVAQNQAGQVQMSQGQPQHGHPAQNMAMANNMASNIQAQQARFLQQQQQLSQAQVSSPVVRNATPHNLSSPMVATNLGVSMQQSTSSMGGSPPRPGSVVQPQMTPAMAHAMRAQSSQQSQGGTPRPPTATPSLAQAMPRQISQTPRMSQGSPMPGNMIQTPQMAQMMPNGQIINAQLQQAQIIAQQQAQQQRMRQQAVQQAMGSSPPNGQQMTPQQYAAMQQQMQHQQQQQQNNPGMINANQMSAQYAAQMRAMAAAQAQNAMQQVQAGQQAQGNFMNANGLTPQQMMAAAQAQQQQQQAQAQQQAQNNTLNQQVRALGVRLYREGLPNLSAQWNNQPPPELLNQFKQQCFSRAQTMLRQMNMSMIAQQQGLRQQQQQQMMAQQQAAAVVAAQQQQQAQQGMNGGMMNVNGNGNMNMNGMNGMGMQRPPGM